LGYSRVYNTVSRVLYLLALPEGVGNDYKYDDRGDAPIIFARTLPIRAAEQADVAKKPTAMMKRTFLFRKYNAYSRSTRIAVNGVRDVHLEFNGRIAHFLLPCMCPTSSNLAIANKLCLMRG
jgi:hypothetical protein